MLIISNIYSEHNPRLTAVRVVVAVCLGILVLALARVQLLHGERYDTREDVQSMRRIRIPSVRGEIVDRHGVVLANNRPSFDIVIYLEQLRQESKRQDIVQAAAINLRSLSAALGKPVTLTDRDVRIHYQKRRPIPLPVWRDVNTPTVAAYEERASSLPATDLMVTPVRQYPQGALAAHLLGFVGRASPEGDEELEHYYYYEPDSVGRQGLELAYDEYLRGAPGGRTIRVSPTGAMVGEIGKKSSERGSRLTLTIDARLQKLVERALADAPLPGGASMRGAAVVLDPRTGEVLAMASAPTFDPNWFTPGTPAEQIETILNDPDHPMINRVYGGLYAPGSTFKPITLLAGLAAGKVTPQDRVFCEGALQIGNWPRPFGCWNRRGHGTLDGVGAMKQSCDIWFYVRGMAAGVDQIERVAREFGLGEQTGLDIGREFEGLVPDPDWKRRERGERWWDGDTAQLSIGQSFLQVTPIQMAVMAAALANGGAVLRPFVVKRAETVDGRVLQDTQPLVRRRVRVAQGDLQIVRRTLLAAVQESDGTAHLAVVPGLTVAGKTGTAEFDVPARDGRPARRINRAWFIGFAPFEAPQIAVAVMIEEAGSGGHDAAPLAGKIIAGAFGKQAANIGARGVYAD